MPISTDSHTDAPDSAAVGKPLVSVVIAVYKPAEEHLRKALESVLAQTYTNFELLLLDDCPEHPSERIVRSCTDSRIHYACNERNLGISETRNRLIDMAKGEFLAILDHDDICRPDRLEKQVDHLLKHPETGVVSSWVRYIPHNKVWELPVEDEHIRMALMFSCAVPHTAAMVRKELFTNHGIRYEQDFTPAEDMRLWIRLLPHTGFHNIPEPLVDYRLHDSNTVKLQKDDISRAHWRIMAYAAERMPELYRTAREQACKVTRIRVLGIPLLRKVSHRDTTTFYLFNKLPILQLKHKFYIH